MADPRDIPCRETLAFLSARLAPRSRVLEIGCGDGRVAVGLAKLGHAVVAIDSDPAAIADARARGANAEHAHWPDYIDDGSLFDAVAFTRSLHHISPLPRAVARAREVLKPSGVVIVEDFAFDEADARSIAWFLAQLRLPGTSALLRPLPGEFVTDLLAANDAGLAWRRSHDHELHAFPAISAAVAREFTVLESSSAPYFYRYCVPVVADSDIGAIIVERLLLAEQQSARDRRISPIGRRLVAGAGPSTACQ